MGDLAKKADDEVELYIRKRMGFFGFALGVALYFFIIFISPVFPFLAYAVSLFTPRYEVPWNYIMLFITPLIWGLVFYFVPYKKSKF
jgi:hypothetical protein